MWESGVCSQSLKPAYCRHGLAGRDGMPPAGGEVLFPPLGTLKEHPGLIGRGEELGGGHLLSLVFLPC